MLFVKNHNTFRSRYLKESIDYYLKEEELTHYSNRLECINLLATGNEAIDGSYSIFFQRINKSIKDSNIKSKEIAKKIEFNVITKKEIEEKETQETKKYFKKFNIIKLKIPNEYDFYQSGDKNILFPDNISGKYGHKSGPNYTFFESFNYLKDYNTTLFLECDVFFGENWIEKIYNYVESSNGFWISGSTYDGVEAEKEASNAAINNHINGGVCLYATKNTSFQKFIKFCHKSFYCYMKINKNLPYDFIIFHIINDYFDYDTENRKIWKFIKRNYIKNNLVFNFSTKKDIEEKIESIQKKYNFVLLHKK